MVFDKFKKCVNGLLGFVQPSPTELDYLGGGSVSGRWLRANPNPSPDMIAHRISFLLVFMSAFGLTARSQHRCQHAEQTQRMHAEHPEWQGAQAMRMQFLSNFTHGFSMESLNDLPGELVIPVVFHVVHDGGDENISDAQIHEAMAQLNEDFSATNPELTEVHAGFVDLVADVGIAFRLADFAPNGDPTTGINRLQSHHTYNGSNIGLKELIQWDPMRYLNIWVVHSSDGGNGSAFAFYPADVEGSASIYDGIVASHWAVGRTGTAVWTHYKILTHEVGHWANLKHTWGDQTAHQSPDGCLHDDEVDDTPNTIGNWGCALDATSCGSLDNVQNFMDYSNCSSMFTTGQKARMVAALCSEVAGRNHLWSPENQASVFLEGDFLPRLVYLDGVFEEADANDGSVESQIPIELLDLQFASTGSLIEGFDFTTSNVPEGLTMSVVVTDSTHAYLQLTGQVAEHGAANSVDSIGIEFTAAPFADVTLADLYNPSKTDLALDFLDPYEVVFVDLVEDAHNFFQGRRWTWFTMGAGGADFGFFHYDLDQIKLETYGNRAICNPGTTRLTPLPAGTPIGPDAEMTAPGPWYPDQLDLSNPDYTDWNGQTAFVGVEFQRGGNAHYGWIRLRVSEAGDHYFALDMAYNEAPEATIHAGEVEAPVLAYTQTVFHEAASNNGSIASHRVVDLFGATWAVFDSLTEGEGFSVSNVPEGLALHVQRLNDAQVELSFEGIAANHNNAADATNLLLTWDPALIEGDSDALDVTQSLSLDFADPHGIVYQAVDPEGSISVSSTGTPWKWFSWGVGDADFGLWYINDHFRLETYHKSGLCHPGSTNLALLQPGDSIGPSGNWAYTTELETQLVITSPTHSDWNGQVAYAGVQFTIAERFHYGWMRFEVSEAGDAVSLLDYAYNAKPGEAIAAGQLFAPYGCTDEAALNFNPFAFEDDGTCQYPLDCGADALLTLNLFDGYGDGWNGNELAFYNALGEFQVGLTLPNGSEGQTQFCLPPGCYAYSAGGGAYLGEISWTLVLGSEEIASGEGGTSGLVGVNASCADLMGCTDTAAFNFDPIALEDDGSCTYPVIGCTDANALNYDPEAEVDDGLCLYADDVLGCTDATALNFNPEATYDDGTCVHPDLSFLPFASEVCSGDSLVISWTGGNPNGEVAISLINATQNAVWLDLGVADNLGTFVWVVDGVEAGTGQLFQFYIQEHPYPPASWSYSTSFAVLADVNQDGVCDGECTGDFNADGLVTIADVLLILSEFGCDGACFTDATGDGSVGINDFLLVLAQFGMPC